MINTTSDSVDGRLLQAHVSLRLANAFNKNATTADHISEEDAVRAGHFEIVGYRSGEKPYPTLSGEAGFGVGFEFGIRAAALVLSSPFGDISEQLKPLGAEMAAWLKDMDDDG